MKKLADIYRKESADLELLHPKTGVGLRAFLILAGPDHPARRRLELERDRTLRQELNRSGRVEVKSYEQTEKEDIEFVLACTLGWYSLDVDPATGEEKRVDAIDIGNGPEHFSAEVASNLYKNRQLSWIFTQAKDGIRSTERFFVDSSET